MKNENQMVEHKIIKNYYLKKEVLDRAALIFEI